MQKEVIIPFRTDFVGPDVTLFHDDINMSSNTLSNGKSQSSTNTVDFLAAVDVNSLTTQSSKSMFYIFILKNIFIIKTIILFYGFSNVINLFRNGYAYIRLYSGNDKCL